MHNKKRALLQLSALLAFITVPLAVQAQDGPTAPKEPKTNSRYATEQPANSGFAVGLHSESSWDDNILGNNAHRVRDYVFEEGGLLSIWSKRQAWKLGLEYRPNALLYRSFKGFNQVDHRLDLDNEFHIASHLLFRLKDSLDYATGVIEPRSNGDISIPIGGSTNLNSTVLTPFARQFANEASGEAELDVSHRTSFLVSGSHGFRRFTNVGNTSLSGTPSLFNTQSDTGSGSYNYRVTRHFTTALEYQYRDYRFSQSSQDRTHGGFLKILWDVSPCVTLSGFAGSEYSNSEGQFVVPSTNPLQPGNVVITQKTLRWTPGGGGSLTLRSNQTVFRLTAQRLVTDGGGLLTTVTNSFEGAEIRRRLAWKWDVALTASNARSVAVQGPLGKGAVNTFAGGMAIEHPLFEDLSLHLGYNYLRQRANQFALQAPDLDRDRFTVGLFYRTHDYRF